MYQLTDTTMREALHVLCRRDPLIARLHDRFGMPSLWIRPQSFATLVHIVLEQKVSLASANAVMQRVRVLCPGMQPSMFLTVSARALRQAGLSQSKLSYCRSIAEALVNRNLSLPGLRKLSDEQVVAELTSVRGIGPWTAGVYLMMALRRPDAWASGDRALVVSYYECEGLNEIPSYKELDAIAVRWIPHRATAARLLWHAYLEKRKLKSGVSGVDKSSDMR